MYPQPKPFLSLDDWLEAERAALEGRSGYLDGEVYAMASASLEHNTIVVNIGSELRAQMKGRPCRVYANDMKVLIRGDKFALYHHIPSLREYLLVSQDRVRVERYRCGQDGRWTLTDYRGLEDQVPLEGLDLYLGVGRDLRQGRARNHLKTGVSALQEGSMGIIFCRK